MYCTRCGVELRDQDRYCFQCGQAMRGAAAQPPTPGYRNKLSRPNDQKKIAGVCAGFARYFEVDVTLVRILWILLIFWPPSVGLIAYAVAWIAMPRDPLYIESAKPATVTG